MSDAVSATITSQFVPDGLTHEQICNSPGWHLLGLKVLARSVTLAPGGLGKSMTCKFVYGPDGRIEIGSKRTVSPGSVALLGLIEQGTKAHYIPRGAPGDPQGGPLAFSWAKGGGDVVFASVHHPPTKKNPFVEKAMQQIIHEAAGLSLVSV